MYLDNKCYTLREEKNPYFEKTESSTTTQKFMKMLRKKVFQKAETFFLTL